MREPRNEEGTERVRVLPLTDRALRSMALRNHQPAEVWTIAGTLVSVHCETCGNAWPCPTRRALADRAAAKTATAVARLTPSTSKEGPEG